MDPRDALAVGEKEEKPPASGSAWDFLVKLFRRWWHPDAGASGPPIRLLMGMFFTRVGIGMVWSILTVYATSLGASAATAGATISVFGASLFLATAKGLRAR